MNYIELEKLVQDMKIQYKGVAKWKRSELSMQNPELFKTLFPDAEQEGLAKLAEREASK